jgi:VIT1/CCC1 family predicted Fe2+/Mn2+ transporter
MTFDFDWIRDSRNRLDIVAGLVDGILNALTLAAAKLVTQGSLTLSLVGKVAAVTGCTTSFVFFVAHYAELRSELVRAARDLNLASRGQLATTRLGKQIFYEALWDAVVASVCGVIGSVIPLAISLAIPQVPVVGIALTIAILGVLGWLLGLSVFGSAALWSGGLILGGIVVTAIGVQLNILG